MTVGDVGVGPNTSSRRATATSSSNSRSRRADWQTVRMTAAPSEDDGAPLKAAVAVANELRRRIVTGAVPVGNSLPAEAKLLDELGVSRPSLRAALRILESESLITMRRGSRGGAWVNAPTYQVLARRAGVYLQYHQVSLDEVHRARLVVEVPAVGILARRADPDDVQILDALAHDEIEVLRDRDAFRATAIGFHRKLVELSGNQMLIVFASMIHGVIEAQAERRTSATSGRYRHGPDRHGEHLEVIELIRAGKAAAAEEVWRDHLETARRLLMAESGANTMIDLLS
jgi:DNA-binding FadR family transcriptional regulator